MGLYFILNTCNGYTKLEDGTKVFSVENRALFFDSYTPHCSTSCTDKLYRSNININYFEGRAVSLEEGKLQRNSLSEHPIFTRVKIYKGILDDDFCRKIADSYASIDKIDNFGEWRDNLLNTHRTVGDAHSHPEVQEVWRGICGLMSSVWNSGQ